MISEESACQRLSSLIRWLPIISFILCSLGAPVHAKNLQSNQNPKQFALIIGVSQIPGLPRLQPLQGVPNDVKAMRSLVERLGVSTENLRVLSDTGGAIAPTYAAISAALQWIEESSDAGSRVLIYFAGHGGQQPAIVTENQAVPEYDGLDEIFFAHDAGPWDETKASAQNVLTDNALRRWLERLNKKNVAVWLIVDMCHAGTFSRGPSQMTQEAAYEIVANRGASLADIGIDPSSPRWRQLAIQGRKAISVFSRRSDSPNSAEYRTGTLKNVVAYYATDEGGQAPEVKPKRRSGEIHGLFTLFLAEEANRLIDSRAIVAVANYRLLMQRILARYRQDMSTMVAPTFEGVDAGTWFGDVGARKKPVR